MHYVNGILHPCTPPSVRNVPYSLCPRVHDRELPVVSAAMRKNLVKNLVPGHILTLSNY